MKISSFFGAIRALLPRSRIFDLTIDGNMRRIFRALEALPANIRTKLYLTYLDFFPATTRALEKWESVFRIHLSASLFTAEERRKVLAALWRMRYGNTTKQFMQEILEQFFPGVQITENVPVVNAPGLVFAYKSVCRASYMVCGNRRAVCDYHVGSRDWLPTVLRNDTTQPWDMPAGDDYSSLCFFISREVYREADGRIQALQRLKIHQKWQQFLEYVVLALKPVHTTAILFVIYVPNDEEIEYT